MIQSNTGYSSGRSFPNGYSLCLQGFRSFALPILPRRILHVYSVAPTVTKGSDSFRSASTGNISAAERTIHLPFPCKHNLLTSLAMSSACERIIHPSCHILTLRPYKGRICGCLLRKHMESEKLSLCAYTSPFYLFLIPQC